ncbi:conserved unknown protein [Ectocarpus siliculosus]|uniref:PDZ domain-containing protein n=1 Tax=Ectocarpus siliculosus TaxID=2880 RepID=D7FNU4_ECTSI|nr:conserved unknown protein [Ectocarpus siliculosus]|eukprot:CBJ30220.1 conserved unknown protein [Ectocarpus siliculosus]
MEQHLGISLSPGPNGESRVTGVSNGGAAAKAGVRVNDTIAAIDGNASPAAHEDLVDVVRAIGRPVVIGFHRSGGGGKEAKGAGATAQEPGPFQRAQDAARRKMDEIKGPPQPPPMTAEAKAERREAALKAAESRTKDWNKRLNKGRQASQTKSGTGGVTENQFEDSGNAETRRMVELAKQQEARTASSMGYNPYEARLMGNTAARAAISGAGDSGAGAPLTSPPPPDRQATTPPPAAAAAATANLGEKEEWIGEEAAMADAVAAEIEGALGAVLEQEPGVSLTAVTTMLKMMKNMTAKSSDDKFKRIRLGNANFNSKVGGIDGGLEVMTAAGFSLQTDGDEPVLQHGPCDPVPLRLTVAIRKLAQAEAMLKDSGSTARPAGSR